MSINFNKKKDTKVSFFNILLVVCCLPLVTFVNDANWGLAFEEWLGYGLVFSAVGLTVCYILYTLLIRKILCERGLLTLSEEQTGKIKRDNKLLIKTIAIAVAGALSLCVCISVWYVVGLKLTIKKYKFDNHIDFKIFMESDYDRWLKEGYSYVTENGDVVVNIPIDPEHTMKTYGHIKNADGEIICEYYYNPDLYHTIAGTESAYDRMPITVITKEDYSRGRSVTATVEYILYALIPINFIIATSIYCLKTNKRNKNT